MKKSMKLVAVLVCLVMMLSVIACTEPEAASTPASDTTAEEPAVTSEGNAEGESNTEPYEIVIVPKCTTNSWFQNIADGGAKFGSEYGVNVYMKGSDEADAAQQIEIIESLISSGVDAMCVIPNDINALETVLQQARDAGIVVVCHEASTQQNCDYDLEAFPWRRCDTV